MGLSSIEQLSLRAAIPVPAPPSPRCSDATLLWGHPEHLFRASMSPLCPAPGRDPHVKGRKGTVSELALPPLEPHPAVTAAFVPDVAGTAGAAQHGNYSLPRPVPSWDGCFPHDRMLSKAPHPRLSRSQTAQPKKHAGKTAWRAGEGSSGSCAHQGSAAGKRSWAQERAKYHQTPLTAPTGSLSSQL